MSLRCSLNRLSHLPLSLVLTIPAFAWGATTSDGDVSDGDTASPRVLAITAEAKALDEIPQMSSLQVGDRLFIIAKGDLDDLMHALQAAGTGYGPVVRDGLKVAVLTAAGMGDREPSDIDQLSPLVEWGMASDNRQVLSLALRVLARPALAELARPKEDDLRALTGDKWLAVRQQAYKVLSDHGMLDLGDELARIGQADAVALFDDFAACRVDLALGERLLAVALERNLGEECLRFICQRMADRPRELNAWLIAHLQAFPGEADHSIRFRLSPDHLTEDERRSLLVALDSLPDLEQRTPLVQLRERLLQFMPEAGGFD